MNFWRLVSQNPQLVVFLLFLAAPVFKAIAKAFARSKQEREYRAAMQRAEAEALRTGRNVGDVPQRGAAPADSSMNDQNARRQLEERAEVRRAAISRAQQRPASAAGSMMGRPPTSQPQTAGAPATAGMIRLKLPNGIVIQVPDPGAGRAAPTTPAPVPPPPRAGKRGPRGATPQRRADAPTLRAGEAPTERAPRTRAAEAAAAVEARRNPEPVSTPLPVRGGYGRPAPGSWRRAVIMAEILGTPPGLR